MTNKLYTFTACAALLLSAYAHAENREAVINGLLLSELESVADGAIPPSWVYGHEGGIIKFAEFDLVGDEKPEVFYDRSIGGELYRLGSNPHVYVYGQNGTEALALPEGLFMEGFHKKENGKSTILKASAGSNYDTPEEKAFTKKLFIQQVTTDGIKNTVHIIDESSSQEMRDLWESANFYYEKKSVIKMEKLGYEYYKPEYQWVSLKGYLNGEEWAEYIDNGDSWSSLNEFSIESRTWSVKKEWVTPEYLKIARIVHGLHKSKPDEFESGIPKHLIELPEGYFMPADALEALRGLISRTGKMVIRESHATLKSSHSVETPSSNDGNAKMEDAKADAPNSNNLGLVIILLGVGVIALLGVVLGYKTRKA